jgi:hypothetical protein
MNALVRMRIFIARNLNHGEKDLLAGALTSLFIQIASAILLAREIMASQRRSFFSWVGDEKD